MDLLPFDAKLHRLASTAPVVQAASCYTACRSVAAVASIWKKHESTADRGTGPTVPGSTVLSIEQEAIIVAFRKYTLLTLDGRLYALRFEPRFLNLPVRHFAGVWSVMA